MKCPNCKHKALKVIYFGFPMFLCCDCERDPILFGFWSFIPKFWFNGAFFVYNGNYLIGLWHFITDIEK